MAWLENSIKYRGQRPLPTLKAGDLVHLGVYSHWLTVVYAGDPNPADNGTQFLKLEYSNGRTDLHLSGDRGYRGIERVIISPLTSD